MVIGTNAECVKAPNHVYKDKNLARNPVPGMQIMTKTSNTLRISLMCVLLSLGLTLACNRTPDNGKLTSDVENRIQSDASLTSKQQITVQANDGVVTLTGTVASDAERTLAGIDASKVDGVKTVVNNLQAAPPVAEAPAAEQSPETAAPAVAPEPEKQERRKSKPSADRRHQRDDQDSTPTPAPAVAQNTPPAKEMPAAPPPPPPPPPVVKVTIPDGTQLAVRLVESLDSGRNKAGDTFHGSLSQPIVIDGKVVIPASADVAGQVTDVKDAAHFTGNSSMTLKLNTLTVNGKTYQISTEEFSQQGKGRGKNTAAKVGGGAAVGALIGGLIGGGKGAAIGAGVGAGGGTAAQAVTKGEQVRLPSESVVNFRLSEPVTVTPVTHHNRDTDAQNNVSPTNDQP